MSPEEREALANRRGPPEQGWGWWLFRWHHGGGPNLAGPRCRSRSRPKVRIEHRASGGTRSCMDCGTGHGASRTRSGGPREGRIGRFRSFADGWLRSRPSLQTRGMASFPRSLSPGSRISTASRRRDLRHPMPSPHTPKRIGGKLPEPRRSAPRRCRGCTHWMGDREPSETCPGGCPPSQGRRREMTMLATRVARTRSPGWRFAGTPSGPRRACSTVWSGNVTVTSW